MTSVVSSFQPTIGCLVHVEKRTWPGINKLGGIGKVVNIIYGHDSNIFVDVKYVLGGEEHHIDMEYVKEHNFDEDKTARRKRSAPAPALQDELSFVPAVRKNKPKKKKTQPLKDSTSASNQERGVVEKIVKILPVSKPKISDSNELVGDNKESSPLPNTNNTCSYKPSSDKTKYLQNLYLDMASKASHFVKQVVGVRKSEPSSPESTCSLDVKIQDEREARFNTVFSDIIRRDMLDSIEIADLLGKINAVCLQDPFTSLELQTHLKRLDAENRVMVTSGTVYMI